MTILRDYQIKFINALRVALSKYRSILACAATGSGKSKTFISICKGAIEKGRTVLVLTESKKIYGQLSKEMPCNDINANNKHAFIFEGQIHIAMSQTLANRPHLLTMLQDLGKKVLVIADEAHIGTMTKVLLQFTLANIIGFTASPAYQWAKHLPAIYEQIVVGPQPEQLVNEGWLSPYKHFERKVAGIENLKTNSTGEFSEESQNAIYEKAVVYEGLFEDLAKTPHNKCIIFTASIHHCQTLYGEMKEAGYDCVQYHTGIKNEKERDYQLAQFEKGTVKYCVTVGMLTKGFDCPPIDLVVLQRATTSLPLYLQMIGRGSRIFPGKDFFTVLDYGENYTRHLPWDLERDWTELWNKKPKKPGVAPMKECPDCGYIMHTTKKFCPNCNYEFPAALYVAPPVTELVERTADYNTLRGKFVSQLAPKELALYAKLKNKQAYAQQAARVKELYEPGYLQAFSQEMGYAPGWVYNQLATIHNKNNLSTLTCIDYELK